MTGDRTEALRLLPDLIANFREWEKTHRDANGLYWQTDDRDGMEDSISGALHSNKPGWCPGPPPSGLGSYHIR